MRRCSRCILPENYPNISFNKEGVCNLCTDFEDKWTVHKRENFKTLHLELKNILEQARKKKGKYDCLVPISGGKDSTYTLYLCKFKYNLKVLAYHFNNGFVSQHASENIKNAVEKMGIDFVSFAPGWNLLKKIYSHLSLKAGGYFCGACGLGYTSTAYKLALGENIPLIVYGGSSRIEGTMPKEMCYSDARWFRHVLQNEIEEGDMENWTHITPWSAVRRYIRGNPKVITLGEYVDWDLREIRETIQERLGWQAPSEMDHTDCIFDPVSDYFLVKKWGFSRKTVIYSARIRDGQMSREEAVRKIAVEESDSEPELMTEFLKKLGLSKDALVSALQSTNHLDYESYLNQISRIHWFLKILRTIKIIPKEVDYV